MLNFPRRLRTNLTDELTIWYWRQVFRLTRWLRHQEPRLVYLRQYIWFLPLTSLVGVLIGLMIRFTV